MIVNQHDLRGCHFSATATILGHVHCHIECEQESGACRDLIDLDLTPTECRDIARRYLRAAEDADAEAMRALCPDLLTEKTL